MQTISFDDEHQQRWGCHLLPAALALPARLYLLLLLYVSMC
jgi:hypothetical protein